MTSIADKVKDKDAKDKDVGTEEKTTKTTDREGRKYDEDATPRVYRTKDSTQ
jgi:hypothetical protein